MGLVIVAALQAVGAPVQLFGQLAGRGAWVGITGDGMTTLLIADLLNVVSMPSLSSPAAAAETAPGGNLTVERRSPCDVRRRWNSPAIGPGQVATSWKWDRQT